jgi:HAD superfamily hydrolase (TIGR01490 family)
MGFLPKNLHFDGQFTWCGNLLKDAVVMEHKVTEQDIVAYFDFDGTITYKDTLVPFVLYSTGFLKFLYKLPRALPAVVLYLLKQIDNETAKQRFITVMLRGMPKDKLDHIARNFAITRLDKYINPEIYNKLEYHKEHRHNIVIVSANLAIYLRYWAKKHHLVNVIATEIEFANGRVTGRLETKNCYGEQKTIRIKEYLKENNYSFAYSYGYGNSRGDYALLDYVDEGYWISDGSIINWSDYNGFKTRK